MTDELDVKLAPGAPATGRPPVPVARVMARGQRLRRARRACWSAAALLVAVSVGVLATPARPDWLPVLPDVARDGSTGEADCNPAEGYTDRVAPSALPPGMVSLWAPAPDRPQPGWGYARRDRRSACPMGAELALIDTERGRVTRVVRLSGPHPFPVSNTQPSPAGPLGSTTERIGQHDVVVAEVGAREHTATWAGREGQWHVVTNGLSLPQLRALLAAATRSSVATPSVEGWLEANEFERVAVGQRKSTARSWWRVESTGYGHREPALSLDVATSEAVTGHDHVLLTAAVGDQLVDVAGRPGITRARGEVSWQLASGLIATLHGPGAASAALLEAARSVTAVDPRDPLIQRIVAAVDG